jgi:hypothetical protein
MDAVAHRKTPLAVSAFGVTRVRARPVMEREAALRATEV